METLDPENIRELFESLPDTAWVHYSRNMEILEKVDRDGVLVNILEGTPGTRTPEHILSPPFPALVADACRNALEGKSVQIRHQGRSGLVKVSTVALGIGKEELSGMLMVQGNEGSLVQYRDELEKEKEEARETSEVKSRFMARISHEIRTPLNAIIGFIEQLQKTALDERQENYLNIIDKSSVYLLDLVNEILTFSKLESGDQKLDLVDFNLKFMFEEVYSTMKIRARAKSINFRYFFDRGLVQVVRGDAFRLKQVVINLISNAIKFTDYGYVELHVRKLSEDNRRVWTGITVTDTGIGIPEERLKDIFKEYKQVSAGIARKHGGTGLGLTISKRLTELMEGNISVESKEGQGSVFSLQIPLEKSELAYLTKDTLKINEEVLSGRRALIVDDDAMNRMLGEIILEGFNMEVLLASDGPEAMELATEHSFDVILLDIHMPGVSGIDVARYIRGHLKNRDVKIMAVTADMVREELDRYLEEGIDDTMIKPYREINLFNKLCQVLEVDPDLIRHETVKIVLKEDVGDSLYDLDELRSVTRDHAGFFNEMLETFNDNALQGIKQLRKSYEEGDWESVRETAHRLTPSFKHLAIRKVVSDLVELKNVSGEKPDPERMGRLITRIERDTDQVIEKLKYEFIRKE